MTDRRTTTPADVPKGLIDIAERALAEAATDNPETALTMRECIREMLAVVLPAYELRLGAEIARFAVPCRTHDLPGIIQADCAPCARYTALTGARRIIEGRDGYADLFPRLAHQETGDGTG